jgi:hypothetical protein
MPELTRRLDPDRADAWRVYFGDVRVGMIGRAAGNPNAADCWNWSLGFYPGCEPGEHRHGTAPTFEAARAAFEAAWRDQQRWTAEKYRRFDRGERMPAAWISR